MNTVLSLTHYITVGGNNINSILTKILKYLLKSEKKSMFHSNLPR